MLLQLQAAAPEIPRGIKRALNIINTLFHCKHTPALGALTRLQTGSANHSAPHHIPAEPRSPFQPSAFVQARPNCGQKGFSCVLKTLFQRVGNGGFLGQRSALGGTSPCHEPRGQMEARAAHVKESHQRNQTTAWTFPHLGRLEQRPIQPRGHTSPSHVREGWGNGQESSDLGYIYSAVSILCSHRESHRASSPAAPRAAWEIKAAH